MSDFDKIDYAPSDVDIIRRNMSDSDINGLIDSLCSARAENTDVTLMDDIQGKSQISPIEQERIALERDNNAIEDELMRNVFENNSIPMTIEEFNDLKAKGLYDKYIQKCQTQNVQEENTMSDIEAEIKANMDKPLPGGIDNITEVMEEKDETVNVTFQTDESNETNNNTTEDIGTDVIEEDTGETHVTHTVLPPFVSLDYTKGVDVPIELVNTINNIVSGKALEEALETSKQNAPEEDEKPMSIEEFNDVPATQLEVADDTLTTALMNKYDGVEASDAIQLIDVMNRYKAGEKFNVFEALPQSIKSVIVTEAMSVGADRSTMNFFAKSFINDLVNDTYIDQEIKDFNSELKEVLEPMNNIVGTMMDEYSDEVRDKFTTQLEEKAKQIKEEDPEKAAQLYRISKNFNESISLTRIIDFITKTPSNINKAYKMARDNWSRVNSEYEEAISNINPKPRSLDLCLHGLKTAGYPEDYAKTIVVLVSDSIKEAIAADALEEHIYAYYLSNGLYNLSFTSHRSESIKLLTKSVDILISAIDEYMAPLKARKTKKNRKNKRK